MIPKSASDALDLALSHSPVQPFFRWRSAGRLRILAYHGIDDPDRFGEHLRYLKREMHPISLDDLLEARSGRGELPPRPVLVTFDDNDVSLAETAAPMLEREGIAAVVFVIAGMLDSEAPYWWTEVEELLRGGGSVAAFRGLNPHELVNVLKAVPDEQRLDAIVELRRTASRPARGRPLLRRADLETLAAAGCSVENHSLTHPCLPQCSDEKLEDEITAAHDLLTAATGRPPRAFAYPNGDWDARAERLLRSLGYRSAFLFNHRLSRHREDPLRTSRIRVNSTTGMDRFRIVMSGLHPALHRLRGRH